jgi:hypothetical protein
MAKCEKCGNKIEYNRFKKYNNKIYCDKCYNKIREEKRTKRKRARKTMQNIISPSEKAAQDAKRYGIEVKDKFEKTIKDRTIESHEEDKPVDPKEE